MVVIAEEVERKVWRVVEEPKARIAPGKVETYKVAVGNDKLGSAITFDPVHILGSGG